MGGGCVNRGGRGCSSSPACGILPLQAQKSGLSPGEAPVRTRKTDILILGWGGAGLLAALAAHDRAPELDILVAVKGLFGKSGCTRMVQGGYNVALSPGDSAGSPFLDTLEGGAWINDQELAWTLVSRAPACVRRLETVCGCFFDRTPAGPIHQKAFPGQSFDRPVHKGDLTGIEITNRVSEQLG